MAYPYSTLYGQRKSHFDAVEKMISGRREGIQQFAKRDKVAVWTCRKTLDRYLENASLHGLRYIGDRELTWFERYE